MKSLALFLVLFAVAGSASAVDSSDSRWRVSPSGTAIVWPVADDAHLPHRDWMEMGGRKVALLFDYTVTEKRTLTLSRRVVWPCVRTQPNNTHASMSFEFSTNGIPCLTADGAVLEETVSTISFDGVWTSVGTTPSGLRVERRVFPSAAAPAAFERWTVTNRGNRPVKIGVTAPSASWIRLGCTGRFVVSAAVDAAEAVELAPGGTAERTLAFSIRRADEKPTSFDGAAEESRRRARVAELAEPMRLETDDPVLDTMFRFAKIRAGESVYETAGGVMHSPGGGSYYAGTWCNDEVEYAGPWFACTGDALLLEASMNAYRQYLPFMSDDYAPIPSSVIAEGRDYWNGAGDRGDAAMWAYGASRFVLAAGRRDWAEELRPGLRWALEYCRRRLTADGVVASDSDEMEGRLPAGKANLHTSVLCYDALRHAAMIEKAFGDGRLAADYERRAARLRAAIDRHFGAEPHGFRTYRYYEGCTVLRSWIGSPLCVGIFDRAEGTADALLSPYLRTRNAGLLSAEGEPTGITWDRSQLYAFRGIFAAGLADRAWDDFVAYSRARLLGEHVPYPVEAWPEGDMRHLSAEGALYCRAVTEGLFGLEPTGFGTYRSNARLPKGLKRMALRNVRAFGRVFDIEAGQGADLGGGDPADAGIWSSDAVRPHTILPLGIGMDRTTEEVAATIRAVRKRAGVDRVVLHAPGHGVRTAGYYDTEGYRGVGRRVKAIQDAVRADGVEVGFLMGPTMNVGINHPWTKFVMQDGRERPFTACPGDPAFRKAFAEHCAAVAEECRPFLYMMEDDFRLFWGTGCFCERHKANPPQAFEDLVLLARDAAKAIHRVSPKTRIGLSAPGGYTREAVRLARALADGDRPFVRWYGTEYGFDNPMRLPDFLWTPIWCRQNLSDGMECVYEADAAPNTAFYGSGARVAACASVMLANGFDGLWYWLTGVGGTETGDPVPNLDAYARHSRDLAAVAACAREGRPVGISAMTPSAGRLLARYGIPYTTTAGDVVFHAGPEAFADRSDEEVRRILSGRVVLDGDAALVLTRRGFSEEIGVRAAERTGGIDFSAERIRADGSVVGSSYHANYGLDGAAVRRLEPAGGEEVSYYFSGTPSNRVQSAMTRHVNALGGRVVVLAPCLKDCTATNMLDFRKRRLLLEMIAWLGGETAVPVCTEKAANLLVFANEDAGKTRLLVHVTQLSCDVLSAVTLSVAPPYRGGRVECLRDGTWTPLEARWDGSHVVIPGELHVYDTLAVRVSAL